MLLRTRRSVSLKGIVSAAKDPQDVYPVQVRKGQILTVRATIAAGTEVEVGIWSGDTGPFDVSAGSTTELLRSTDGFTAQPVVSWRARRTGRYYYVSVEAPDVPTQAQVAEGTTVPAAQDRYTLSLRRSGKAANSKRRRGT